MKKIKAFAVAAILLIIANFTMAQVAPVDKNKLANGGYDVVSYFTDAKATKGIKKFAVPYNGANYFFASNKNKAAFKANPAQYLPQCAGYCAWGVAEKSARFPINPETFKIIDGKLYLFFNGDYNGQPFNTLTEWNKDEKKQLSSINANWNKIKDAN
jgi:YHS domain-containing protein